MSAPEETPLDVVVLDLGIGNLHSIRKALERSGARVTVTQDPELVRGADALVLPGVGAFQEAAKKLDPFRDALAEVFAREIPVLGICIGMQILFESSEEGPGKGLGLIRGEVKRLAHDKLPQIGWNVLAFRNDPIFDDLTEGTHVYFVNSFAPEPREAVTLATSTYGRSFSAVVRKGNVYATQFHPEKSSEAGLRIVANWVRIARNGGGALPEGRL